MRKWIAWESLGMCFISSSLQELSLIRCNRLRSVWRGLLHLSSLKKLRIEACPNVNLSNEDEIKNGICVPSQSFHHSLRSLILDELPLLVNLPDWIQNLVSLDTLEISSCKDLGSIPAWMSNLTALKKLLIYQSSADLQKRCQSPTGEDWIHIQKIPKINIYCKVYGDNEILPAPPLPLISSI